MYYSCAVLRDLGGIGQELGRSLTMNCWNIGHRKHRAALQCVPMHLAPRDAVMLSLTLTPAQELVLQANDGKCNFSDHASCEYSRESRPRQSPGCTDG